MRNTHLDDIARRVAPLRQRLVGHRVYETVQSLQDLQIFMESHAFAVWDFMSLLKALQRELTCLKIPWTPNRFALGRRFINEIVLCEESDVYGEEHCSHFELYLRAMRECGANTRPIADLIQTVQEGIPLNDALRSNNIPEGAGCFCRETFRIVLGGSAPALAGAFTFGREDLIPAMFGELVQGFANRRNNRVDIFSYYLQRHIEVDGDDHGPTALRMMEEICGEDADAWRVAGESAEHALAARIALWDSIVINIERKRTAVA